MSDSLSQIIIPFKKQRTNSPLGVFRLPLQAARGLLRPPRLTMCFKFGRCRMYFYPNFSISLPLCHTSGSWREECLPPSPLTSTEKTSEPMFRLQALNCIMIQDAKLSNDMHGCYWSKVFGSIPLWKLSTGELACERTGAFPCDFTFMLKNRLSNDNKYSASALLWPRGEVVHFLSPDAEDI